MKPKPNMTISDLKAAKVLMGFGIKMKSYVVDEVADFPNKKHAQLIKAVMGETQIKIPVNQYYTKLLAMYLVQHVVAEDVELPLDKNAFALAYRKTCDLVKDSPIAIYYNWLDPNKEAIMESTDKPPMEGSNQHKATELYKENKDLDKDTLIGMFVDSLGLSRATAVNYYYAARRAENPNAKNTKGKKKDPNSKFNKAKKLFGSEMTREDFVKQATSTIDGMKESTATNYYYRFKKET